MPLKPSSHKVDNKFQLHTLALQYKALIDDFRHKRRQKGKEASELFRPNYGIHAHSNDVESARLLFAEGQVELKDTVENGRVQRHEFLGDLRKEEIVFIQGSMLTYSENFGKAYI